MTEPPITDRDPGDENDREGRCPLPPEDAHLCFFLSCPKHGAENYAACNAIGAEIDHPFPLRQLFSKALDPFNRI